MYHAPGGGAHAGAHDQHLHLAQHRDGVQPAQHLARTRIAPRAAALVHRDGVGLLYPARLNPLSARDRHPVLGEVLRSQHDGRLVGLHSAHSSAGDLCGVRAPLLPLADDAQVRGDRVRHSGVGDTQGADGAGPFRSAAAPSRDTAPVRAADRVMHSHRLPSPLLYFYKLHQL